MEPPFRHRSPSFSPLETNLLLDLVEKYGSIITKKCTKSASIIEKERIWQKIAKQFNEANAGSHSRPPETLKLRWDNLKKRCARNDGTFENWDIFSKVQAIIETYKDTESTSVTVQKLANDSDTDLNNVNMEDINVRNDRDSSDTEDDSACKRINCHRSPSFSTLETNLLLDLVQKYGSIITKKCTKSASIIEKERIWQKITKQFNEANAGSHPRPTETLRKRWDNLKKRCAKSDGTFENRDILSKVQAIIETYKDTESTSVTLQKLVNDSEGDSAYKRIKTRSINFSPLECQLLIRLVKNEKGGVFSSETKEKFRAWRRIAEAFNRRFPEKKRTARVLRTKFQNMKNVAKKLNKPVMGQKNNIKGIKEEPVFLTNTDYSNDMSDFNEMQDVSIITETDDCPDPLKVALDNCNSDSGIGPGSDTFKISQDKEVIALHKQLLDYQLETSKLERKRIQDAIDAETEDKRVKSLINAMKLRTARLEMVIAESKLHGSHPALKYTDDEAIISRCC